MDTRKLSETSLSPNIRPPPISHSNYCFTRCHISHFSASFISRCWQIFYGIRVSVACSWLCFSFHVYISQCFSLHNEWLFPMAIPFSFPGKKTSVYHVSFHEILQ